MPILDNKQAHLERYAQFAAAHDSRTAAFKMVGGGDEEMIGFIEMLLVDKYLNLTGCKKLIDIGCGPGRLARYLKERRDLSYLGTDVVPQLLEQARQECGRTDWDFVEVNNPAIPAADASADAIAIISVFTNIFPEQAYLLTLDSARVLKPGGRLLVTYMDIAFEHHQRTFLDLTKHYAKRLDPLVFLDEIFLRFFARDAGLKIIAFVPPSNAQVEVPSGARLIDGREASGMLGLGQTLCVMEKSPP